MATWEHKYRPTTYDSFVVASRAETAVRLARNRARRARDSGYPLNVCLCGPSGVGKSSLAYLLATQELGASNDGYSVRRINARRASDALAELAEGWAESTIFGSGWRCLIIEEGQKLHPNAVTELLTLAEAGIPKRAIFVTTTDRADQLPGGSTGPFCSRFAPLLLTAEGMAEAGARRLREIAQAEGADSKPHSYYVGLMRKCENNLRLAIQRLEDAATV